MDIQTIIVNVISIGLVIYALPILTEYFKKGRNKDAKSIEKNIGNIASMSTDDKLKYLRNLVTKK